MPLSFSHPSPSPPLHIKMWTTLFFFASSTFIITTADSSPSAGSFHTYLFIFLPFADRFDGKQVDLVVFHSNGLECEMRLDCKFHFSLSPLAFLSAPRMTEFTFLKDEYALGENASAVCIAISGRQPFRFRWLKDGNLLRPSGSSQRVSLATIALVSTLEIQDVRLEDHANYSCEVANTFGKVSHTAPLRVIGMSSWTKMIRLIWA